MAAAPPLGSHRRPRFGFLLEQTLGHRSYADSLCRILPTIDSIEPVIRSIHFEPRDQLVRMPGYSNWTVRAGIRTGRVLREMAEPPVDALFFHTQVVATLAGRWMKRIPAVVSLDATPRQYDEMGLLYEHRIASRPIEAAKHVLNRRCFHLAANLVAWSEWCRDSLVGEYEVPPEKITVIAPGVDIGQWSPPTGRRHDDGVIRILFVGGDIQRKGGALLVEAVRRVRALLTSSADAPTVELHLVTNADVADEPGVHVHRHVQPNSPQLIDLYHRASIFCLPTLGDCLPMVLSEAGAAGLPVISTRIGAIDEIIHDGDNGLLVAPGDVDALAAALHRLVNSPDLRRRMGQRAEKIVAERFNTDVNVRKLVDVLADVAGADPNGRNGNPLDNR
jgi:glycosyltransferase involved in cell wall biosynthesis